MPIPDPGSWANVPTANPINEPTADAAASRDPADATASTGTQDVRAKVGLLELGATFFLIGATTFGGMWAATQKLEERLVQRKRWISSDDQQMLMVAATLIPAPKFLAFGAMVGYRLRGLLGSVMAAAALLAPGALFVLLGAIVLNPEVVGAPLLPIRRAVGIAIAGLLFGNAFLQLKNAKAKDWRRQAGIALAFGVAGAAIAGVPLLLAALVGFVIGAVTLGRKAKT